MVVLRNNPDPRVGDRAIVTWSNGGTEIYRFGEYYGHCYRENRRVKED
jgi:hypothetical protein